MADVKPTDVVVEYAPWSISKAEVAKQCPHRFYLQYVLKKKVSVPPTPEALIGKAVHSALEYAIGAKGKMSINKCFKVAILEHKLTTKEIENALGLRPAVENFIKKYWSYTQRHNLSAPILEQKLSVDFNGKATRFWDNDNGLIRGVVDMSARYLGRPWSLILDHKTGKERDLSYFDKQFDAYALFLKSIAPELEEIKLGINFIRADRIELKKGMLDVRDIQPMFERVLTFLNEATCDAHNHELVRPGPLCGWCNYRSECPAHADGANGKQTAK